MIWIFNKKFFLLVLKSLGVSNIQWYWVTSYLYHSGTIAAGVCIGFAIT